MLIQYLDLGSLRLTNIFFLFETTATRSAGEPAGVPRRRHCPASQRRRRLPPTLPRLLLFHFFLAPLAVAAAGPGSKPIRVVLDQWRWRQQPAGGRPATAAGPRAGREGSGQRRQRPLAGGRGVSHQSSLCGTQWDSAAGAAAVCWTGPAGTLQPDGKTVPLALVEPPKDSTEIESVFFFYLKWADLGRVGCE